MPWAPLHWVPGPKIGSYVPCHSATLRSISAMPFYFGASEPFGAGDWQERCIIHWYLFMAEMLEYSHTSSNIHHHLRHTHKHPFSKNKFKVQHFVNTHTRHLLRFSLIPAKRLTFVMLGYRRLLPNDSLPNRMEQGYAVSARRQIALRF
jgi:hypothetical protein